MVMDRAGWASTCRCQHAGRHRMRHPPPPQWACELSETCVSGAQDIAHVLDFHACPRTGVSDDHLWHVVAANTANPALKWWCKATDAFRDEGREASDEASSDPPSAIRGFVDERGAVQTTPDWRAVELSSWVHEVLPDVLVESLVPEGVVGVPAHREH